MALTGLHNPDLKLILFGGKGGVGKTSCATATAIELSKNFSTLLISTDPAHSIVDCLGQKTEYGVHGVDCVNNLSVIEIVADRAFKDFKTEHEEELKSLFDTSTNLDQDDIHQLMDLSVPGIDELMSFKMIFDFIEEGKYQKYVVDTAPTGHALRLISSPVLLDKWIKVAARLRWKYRYMLTSFSGSYKQDSADTLLLSLKKTVNRIEELLHNVNRCEFIPICIPESMAVLETGRLVSNLKKFNLTIRQMIINNVMESDECGFCKERKAAQHKYLEQIRTNYSDLNRVAIPLFTGEIKGLEKLNNLRTILFTQVN
jgi:arsenite-transporting ATPase